MAERILVVDDDDGMLEVCEVGLGLAGFELTTAASGDRALRQELASAYQEFQKLEQLKEAFLARAFQHLLHNAVVFSREGGSVRVQGRALPGHVSVAVSDTGEGIPEAEFQRIFDSFYQIAEYLTRKVGGQGSTFTVVLPAEGRPG